MVPEGSLPRLQQPTICSHPEPYKSRQHVFIPISFKSFLMLSSQSAFCHLLTIHPKFGWCQVMFDCKAFAFWGQIVCEFYNKEQLFVCTSLTCWFLWPRRSVFTARYGLGLLNKIKVSVSLEVGPKREKVTGKWRKLHNEELNDLYCSPNIVRMIKSRKIRWVGHVACMGERRGVYRVWWETCRKETT